MCLVPCTSVIKNMTQRNIFLRALEGIGIDDVGFTALQEQIALISKHRFGSHKCDLILSDFFFLVINRGELKALYSGMRVLPRQTLNCDYTTKCVLSHRLGTLISSNNHPDIMIKWAVYLSNLCRLAKKEKAVIFADVPPQGSVEDESDDFLGGASSASGSRHRKFDRNVGSQHIDLQFDMHDGGVPGGPGSVAASVAPDVKMGAEFGGRVDWSTGQDSDSPQQQQRQQQQQQAPPRDQPQQRQQQQQQVPPQDQQQRQQQQQQAPPQAQASDPPRDQQQRQQQQQQAPPQAQASDPPQDQRRQQVNPPQTPPQQARPTGSFSPWGAPDERVFYPHPSAFGAFPYGSALGSTPYPRNVPWHQPTATLSPHPLTSSPHTQAGGNVQGTVGEGGVGTGTRVSSQHGESDSNRAILEKLAEMNKGFGAMIHEQDKKFDALSRQFFLLQSKVNPTPGPSDDSRVDLDCAASSAPKDEGQIALEDAIMRIVHSPKEGSSPPEKKPREDVLKILEKKMDYYKKAMESHAVEVHRSKIRIESLEAQLKAGPKGAPDDPKLVGELTKARIDLKQAQEKEIELKQEIERLKSSLQLPADQQIQAERRAADVRIQSLESELAQAKDSGKISQLDLEKIKAAHQNALDEAEKAKKGAQEEIKDLKAQLASIDTSRKVPSDSDKLVAFTSKIEHLIRVNQQSNEEIESLKEKILCLDDKAKAIFLLGLTTEDRHRLSGLLSKLDFNTNPQKYDLQNKIMEIMLLIDSVLSASGLETLNYTLVTFLLRFLSDRLGPKSVKFPSTDRFQIVDGEFLMRINQRIEIFSLTTTRGNEILQMCALLDHETVIKLYQGHRVNIIDSMASRFNVAELVCAASILQNIIRRSRGEISTDSVFFFLHSFFLLVKNCSKIGEAKITEEHEDILQAISLSDDFEVRFKSFIDTWKDSSDSEPPEPAEKTGKFAMPALPLRRAPPLEVPLFGLSGNLVRDQWPTGLSRGWVAQEKDALSGSECDQSGDESRRFGKSRNPTDTENSESDDSREAHSHKAPRGASRQKQRPNKPTSEEYDAEGPSESDCGDASAVTSVGGRGRGRGGSRSGSRGGSRGSSRGRGRGRGGKAVDFLSGPGLAAASSGQGRASDGESSEINLPDF